MKNSIEEDIKILETLDYLLDDVYSTNLVNDEERNKYQYAIEHILSDYKRALKENKELKSDNDIMKQDLNGNILYVDELEENYISIQKVKDKIEEEKLPLTIVGGRRNRKTLEYGIKLGRRQVLQELIEESEEK